MCQPTKISGFILYYSIVPTSPWFSPDLPIDSNQPNHSPQMLCIGGNWHLVPNKLIPQRNYPCSVVCETLTSLSFRSSSHITVFLCLCKKQWSRYTIHPREQGLYLLDFPEPFFKWTCFDSCSHLRVNIPPDDSKPKLEITSVCSFLPLLALLVSYYLSTWPVFAKPLTL